MYIFIKMSCFDSYFRVSFIFYILKSPQWAQWTTSSVLRSSLPSGKPPRKRKKNLLAAGKNGRNLRKRQSLHISTPSEFIILDLMIVLHLSWHTRRHQHASWPSSPLLCLRCRCFPHSLHFDGHLWWRAALLHGAGAGAVPQNRSHIHMEAHLPHFQRWGPRRCLD